jgi:rubrerythrin
MTTAKRWTLDDIPWDSFDPSKVDADMLKVAKAAALVEYNARDYGDYLRNVFHDDETFRAVSDDWVEEEIQHGLALGRWASLADPSFDFDRAVERFRKQYRINVDAQASIRGSRAGELIARCMVETGTSSYYTALADAADEPVLKAICLRIAADELRHYKLFYTHLKGYLIDEKLTTFQRGR